MIELQLLWARPGQLCLWGTDEGRPVDAGVLESGIAEVLTGPMAEAANRPPQRRVFSLALPGSGTTLVPALELGPPELFPVLARTAEEDELRVEDERPVLGFGLAAGDSLRCVAQLDRFALELIAAGRLLPAIERTTNGWHACWRASVGEGIEHDRLDELTDALPGSLIAAAEGAGRSEAITSILDLLLDGRARHLLSNGIELDSLPNGTHGQDGRLLAEWLAALTRPDGNLGADPELAPFAERLTRWISGGQRSGEPTTRPAGNSEATKTKAPPRKLQVTLKASPAAGNESPAADEGKLFALDGLCDFEWRVAIGDQKLTIAELRELAASQLPLIKSDGRWAVVSPEQVSAALETIEKYGESGRTHAGELLRDSLALTPSKSTSVSPRPATGISTAPQLELETDGWLSLLSGNADSELDEPEQPRGLRGRLRPYQRRGFAWLDLLSRLGLGACLADDMGLGKTIQLLALLLAERERTARPAPTLLICPVSVVGNWRREAERFAPGLRLLQHYGPQRRRGDDFRIQVADADLVITSYSIVTRDRDLLASIQWDRVVLDEAQNIKSRRARQTQAIRALQARHRVALTGTPVENRLTELHSIMDFLNPGLLGSADAFKQQIARPIELWRDPDAAAQLRQATAPFILRRLKTDRSITPDLPEKIEMRTDCLLTREQAGLYQAVVDDLMAAANRPEGIARSGAILAALTRLKQVCNHPAQLLGDHSRFAKRSGKLERLEEILEEALAEGDRTLCFTQFSGFGQRLAWHLADLFDCEVPFLHGGSSRQERDEMVKRFQSKDGPPIFILSLRAGGVGLNLTAANQVIHFDRWWNPAVEDQATDRAYRIGQKRNVQVRKLTCVGTLEERIDLLLDRKRDLAEMIVGSGESWITKLDSSRLRELVALSPEAISLSDGEAAEPSAGSLHAGPGDEMIAA